MKTFEIDGKTYTDRQLAEAIRTYVRENGDRPLTDILVQPPRSPVLKAMVLSVRDDPVARYVVKQQLQAGEQPPRVTEINIAGVELASYDALLSSAEVPT